MTPDNTSKRLDELSKLSQQGKRIDGLFRLMKSPILWIHAYANIYSNKGAATKGVDGTTMDGFSDERAMNLIKLLEENRYKPKPARRAYIPKANGKKRPLGIQTGDDKLVQEVSRMILERIYEPIFSNNSHGFRPNRSCHTALRSIRASWSGVKWIIDMDIRGFFDNMHHKVMMQLLEKRINDKRFLSLIQDMLKAGYLEDWIYHKTYSGVPQGGIVSPIMSNIYLHELDEFMEGLRARFNKGKKRAVNPEYAHYTYQIHKLRNEYDRLKKEEESSSDRFKAIRSEIRNLILVRRKLPSCKQHDPGYRRLRYCRYADDFVIGLIGTKAEAEQVMEEVRSFIQNELKLSIAEEKSGVRKSCEPTRFLGYDMMCVYRPRVVKTLMNGRHTTMRPIAEQLQLHIPQEKLLKFCHSRGYGNYKKLTSIHKPGMDELSIAEIIKVYNAELRGIANYYGLANMAKVQLRKLFHVGFFSLLKTLAYKQKTSVAKIITQLRNDKGDYVHTVTNGKKTYTVQVFRMRDYNPDEAVYGATDLIPSTTMYTNGSTELTRRMLAGRCEYCGRTDGYWEVHHIRKMKDVQDGKEHWQKMMAKRRRKTLVLCVECHRLLHQGKLPSWMTN